MIFSPGFLLHSKRKQIQKKKHLNPSSKNYRILSCFCCCCLLCGCVAFWSRLSRLLCVALRDLLNARGFLFNHSIAFDFADVFLLLFGVVSLSHICERFNSGTELSVSQIANFGLSSVVFFFALFWLWLSCYCLITWYLIFVSQTRKGKPRRVFRVPFEIVKALNYIARFKRSRVGDLVNKILHDDYNCYLVGLERSLNG